MRKYFTLVTKYLSLAWQSTLEYRQNFYIWSLVDFGWALMDILFFSVLIGTTKSLGNWNLGQALIVLGLQRSLVIFVWGWMWSSFSQLPRLVSQGRFDMLLVKPMDTQFAVSTLNFSYSILPSIITGPGFIWYGFKLLNLSPSLFQIISFIWLCLVSIVLIYGVYFLSMSTILHFDRLNNLHHIFTSLYDATKYPKEIFNIAVQRIFTTVLPLSLMITVPAESLFKPPSYIVWFWLHLVALLFIFSGRRIWISSLRRYSSASS